MVIGEQLQEGIVNIFFIPVPCHTNLTLATETVDADLKDDAGWTPLSSAAGEKHEAVVKLLLATGKVDAITISINRCSLVCLYKNNYKLHTDLA